MFPYTDEDDESEYDALAFITEGRRRHHGTRIGRVVSEPIDMHAFTSGAKSTEVKPRYDLVPFSALRYIAERLGFGAARHGERNWHKGRTDPEFIRDRKNHAIEHLLHYVAGETTGPDKSGKLDTPKDHLKAAITNLAMLADIEEFQEHLTAAENFSSGDE